MIVERTGGAAHVFVLDPEKIVEEDTNGVHACGACAVEAPSVPVSKSTHVTQATDWSHVAGREGRGRDRAETLRPAELPIDELRIPRVRLEQKVVGAALAQSTPRRVLGV